MIHDEIAARLEALRAHAALFAIKYFNAPIALVRRLGGKADFNRAGVCVDGGALEAQLAHGAALFFGQSGADGLRYGFGFAHGVYWMG